MLLRASVVLPVSAPVIGDGAVLVTGRRIKAVARWRQLARTHSGPTTDLGEVVLLPGLVNAHCHLDYTLMAGQFPPPRHFTDWLRLITSTKSAWTLPEYERSWKAGAEMLLRNGTTTVGDIEAVPELLPDIWSSTPLRVISFLEMIGITSRRPPRAVVREVLDKIGMLTNQRRVGLSPHAPYSTVPELLQRTARLAARRRWRVCTHIAESAVEYEMFQHGRGDLYDWMKRSGRDMSDCGLGSPVRHVQRHGLLAENLLAAHVNYLGRSDAKLLRKHRVSVVHCPRSHTYFHHGPFDWQRLERAGVNICLGTDSLASVCRDRGQPLELSMFEEMRALAGREPGLSSRKILRMATVNGARALGLGGKCGELSPGGLADLIAIPLPAGTRDVHDAILQHRGAVSASMIEGRWIISPTYASGLRI